jgi:CRP-like cAMP-binding protein
MDEVARYPADLFRRITFYYTRIAMPISKRDFETESTGTLALGEGTQPRRILRFLADNPETAFTQTEIHEATGIKRGSVGGVLSRLESRGLVRHRGRYWMVAKDDRLAAYSAQKSASSASVTDNYFEGIDANGPEDL